MNKKIECLCVKCKNYKKKSNSKFFCDEFTEIFEDIITGDCLCAKCKYHNEKKYKFNSYCYKGTEENQREL
uniref:DUF2769 domain-containing protein n=1 Tax=candidate division WOR-3 bacterium TaxID=2052148 RepID=A0A7C3J714_UNCW3